MAVAVDATASAAATSSTDITTITNSGLTVGAGATALLAIIAFDQIDNRATSIVVKWDNAGTPQTMTLLADGESQPNTNMRCQLYGIVSPTTGNKNLTATWAGATCVALMAQSYTGTPTTTVASAFTHAATNTGSSGNATVSVASAVGNLSAAVVCSNPTITNITATGSTSLFAFADTLYDVRSAAARAPGAATVSWTSSATATEWCTAGIDIVAAVVAANPRPSRTPLLGPILAQ